MPKNARRGQSVPASNLMELYLSGQITAQEYVQKVADTSSLDSLRKASEERVKRILKAVGQNA